LTSFSFTPQSANPTLQPLPQREPPLYIRSLQQYETPVARPKGDFKGYDDLGQGQLRTIWADLDFTRKPVNNVGNLQSFEEEVSVSLVQLIVQPLLIERSLTHCILGLLRRIHEVRPN
jgi:hypothetical protein